MASQWKHRTAGFTLFEFIVALGLGLLLATLATPTLTRLLDRHRLYTAQTGLMASLQATRTLAVIHQSRAMLCPSRDGRRCSDELHWESGWLVGHYRSDNADQLEGTPHFTRPGQPRITILSTAGRRRVRYQADGSAGGSNVSFTLCRTGHAEDALSVVVSNAGRAYQSTPTLDQAARCAMGG
ncbi:GspH/FimT family pseudopilin [Dyella sp. ASV21]|uniref:GspH/FimT family pseudopilin n=1 Tax=Dyella sp. ASV21 TaxID=2795114 RepID=UPI0018EA9269|nr:GspH/FimT family pseudopilin [Dyella sp. ASV21]